MTRAEFRRWIVAGGWKNVAVHAPDDRVATAVGDELCSLGVRSRRVYTPADTSLRWSDLLVVFGAFAWVTPENFTGQVVWHEVWQL